MGSTRASRAVVDALVNHFGARHRASFHVRWLAFPDREARALPIACFPVMVFVEPL